MSTTPPFRPCAATRRPFKRTKVPAAPCPRRFAEDAPLLPRCAPPTTSALLARLSRPLPLVDRKLISCSGLLMPSRLNSSLVRICSGNELSLGSRLMRDPVTTMGFPSASAVSVVVGASVVVSCANAGVAKNVDVASTASVKALVFNSPSCFNPISQLLRRTLSKWYQSGIVWQ
jgi:hypothetical protein